MKNVDKIKELEKELGRFKKKVGDDGKVIERLREDIEGYKELLMLQGAICATLIHLQATQSENQGGGNIITLPIEAVRSAVGKYNVRTKYDETRENYLIWVEEVAPAGEGDA